MRISISPGILIIVFLFPATGVKAEHQTQASISFGGRLKIDAIYNDESVSGAHLSKADLAFSPGSVPITDRDRDSREFNLRESRLWSTLKLPVFQQELAAYAEIDFFDTKKDNQGRSRLSNIPRLRHAYASFGSFTLGKTYTSFLNISSFPEINDANGPVGVLIVRQPIIRYRHDFSRGNFQISLEEPETTLTDSSGKRVLPDDESMPDLAAKITYESDSGNVSLAAILRNIETDKVNSTSQDDEHLGGAVSLSGRWQVFDRDNIRFSLSWGNVLGRYLSYNIFSDGAIDDQGNIELTEVSGGHLAYQHWWTSTVRSSVVAGMAIADLATDIVPPNSNEKLASANLNLIWSPLPDLTLGVEWLYGYRRLIDERSGRLNRLQFSGIYRF